MTSPMISEALMWERQRQLEAAAARARQAHQVSPLRRAPLRTGAGWMLVRAGLRLAHADLSTAPSHHLAAG